MKRRNLIILSACAVIVIAVIIRVVYINNKYPLQKNNVIASGQELNFKDCQIKASNFQIGDPEMCKSLMDDYDYNKMFGSDFPNAQFEKKVILVTVDIKNNSDKEFKPSSYLQIVSGNVVNSTDFSLMEFYNKDGYKVKPNSEAQIVLTYIISNVTVSKKKWSNIENDEFALSCANINTHNLLMLKK